MHVFDLPRTFHSACKKKNSFVGSESGAGFGAGFAFIVPEITLVSSRTLILLSIDSIFLGLIQHHVDPCDS